MNEEKFIEKNGKTYKKKGEKYVRVLEKDEIESILFMTHDHATGGHFGIDATYNKISEKYYWKGMKEDIKEYIRTCDKCQRRGQKEEKDILIQLK